jgi:hypothetical protein
MTYPWVDSTDNQPKSLTCVGLLLQQRDVQTIRWNYKSAAQCIDAHF